MESLRWGASGAAQADGAADVVGRVVRAAAPVAKLHLQDPELVQRVLHLKFEKKFTPQELQNYKRSLLQVL